MLNTFDIREFLSSFIVLFAIIDILGTTPIVINLKKRGKIINPLKASILSFCFFVGFFYIGEGFLKLFNLDISSFAIAGSVILFVMAFEMILDIQIFRDSPDLPKDATVTPIVFPLIAGAGSLTTLLTMRSQFEVINIMLGILLNVIVVYFILKWAKYLEKYLGPGILYMLQKLFGIVLLAISSKLFITNLSILMKTLD